MNAHAPVGVAQARIDYLLGKADHAERHARDWAERGDALQVSRWRAEAERLRRRAKLIVAPGAEFWLVGDGAGLERCADFAAAVEAAEEIGPKAQILAVRGADVSDATAEARDARLTLLMRRGALHQASAWAQGL